MKVSLKTFYNTIVQAMKLEATWPWQNRNNDGTTSTQPTPFYWMFVQILSPTSSNIFTFIGLRRYLDKQHSSILS
jgi:hypothetical protein